MRTAAWVLAAAVVAVGCAKGKAGQSDTASFRVQSAETTATADRSTTPPSAPRPDSAGERTALPDTLRTGAAMRRDAVAVAKPVQTRSPSVSDSARKPRSGRLDTAATATSGGASNSSAPTTTVTAARVKVNEFLSYDTGAKTAYLKVIGGFNNTNSSLNFNGGAKGDQTVTIPLGWRVQASFENRDGDLPHSAIVINDVTPIPNDPPPAAFRAAFTVKLLEGLQDGGADDMSFTANKEGKFLIFCGVPGHGVGGMYINMMVSSQASVPAYQS